jgi:glycine/D-amino acid oxidase-like deaminating enzyme
MRVAIVGAGLAGAALASALGQRGAEVTVFDETGAAAGASGVPVGVLQPLPGLRLSLDPENLAGMAETCAWLDAHAPVDSWRPTSLLRLAPSTEYGASWPQRVARMPEGLATWCDAEAVRQREPLLAVGDQGGVWLPQARTVRVPLLVSALLRQGRAAVLSGLRVQAVAETPDAAWVVLADGERRPFDRVWVAAGTRTPALLPELAPLSTPMPGEVLLVQSRLAPTAVVGWRGNIVPMGPPVDGWHSLVISATYAPGESEARVTSAGQDELWDRLVEALPQVAASARRVGAWCGVRPVLQSMQPQLGVVPNYTRVRVSWGLGSRGLLLAIRTARLEAERVLGNA